jgi:hypothetical protein
MTFEDFLPTSKGLVNDEESQQVTEDDNFAEFQL